MARPAAGQSGGPCGCYISNTTMAHSTRTAFVPLAGSEFSSAFPSSRKVYVEDRGVRVPMREIALSNGE